MKAKTLRAAIYAAFAALAILFSTHSFAAQLAAGQQAPSFSLQNLEGKAVSLEDILKGKKAVLLNFWATWCPSCRREIPQLIALEKEYASKGLAIVGIDVGESPEKVTAYRQNKGVTYPLIMDRSSEIAGQYGVVGLPVSFLLDAKGHVVAQYHEFSEKLTEGVKKELG
jgi:peroxiredoxin